MMMFFLTTVILLFITGFNAVPLKYMSFWEYDPNDFAGWCNFAVSANTTQIKIGQSLNISHLWNIEGFFFEGSGKICNTTYGGTLNPLILKSNYKAIWDQYYPTIHELYYVNKSIFGFFMGDELVWNGLDPVSLNTAVEFIRNNISDAIIYTNAATPPVQNDVDGCGHKMNYNQISSYLDWFSIDMYHFNGQETTFVDSVKTFYEKYVFPKMNLNKQYALCVPGSFTSTQNKQCNAQCYDQMCEMDAWNFYNWTVSDERIIGLYPWHWKNDDIPVPDELGTKGMNLTKAAWNEIGKKIINQ
eukprot:212076_1